MKKKNCYWLLTITLMLLPFVVKAYTINIEDTEHVTAFIAPTSDTSRHLDQTTLSEDTHYLLRVNPEEGYSITSISALDTDGKSIVLNYDIAAFSYRFANYYPAKDLTITIEVTKKETVENVPSLSEEFSTSGDKCVIINGDGKQLGSEVVCGTEHFYVLSNDGDKVRLLSKHNLNVGNTIYKEKVNKKKNDSRTPEAYCYDLARLKQGQPKTNGNYSGISDYCFYEIEYANPEVIKQSMNHSSAHFEGETYLYPQAGDVYLESSTNRNIDSSITYVDTSYSDYLINIDDTRTLSVALHGYKNTMEGIVGNIDDIDILSLSEINNYATTLGGTALPLQEWGDAVKALPSMSVGVPYTTYAEFGIIKNYIPTQYSWLWSTSYWLSTVFASTNTYNSKFYMFVAANGKVCGSGFSYCQMGTELGTGVRPVITISSSKLRYIIRTKTDGHGTIEVIDSADGDEEITFKVDSEEGYELKSLTIISDSGEEVTFEKGEFTTNEDGSITITKNRFIMPYNNVTIIASFENKNTISEIIKEIINPETRDSLVIVMGALTFSIFAFIMLLRIKKNKITY